VLFNSSRTQTGHPLLKLFLWKPILTSSDLPRDKASQIKTCICYRDRSHYRIIFIAQYSVECRECRVSHRGPEPTNMNQEDLFTNISDASRETRRKLGILSSIWLISKMLLTSIWTLPFCNPR
jgi:hypothetical protein